MMDEITLAIIDRSELFKSGIRQALSIQRGFDLIDCNPDNDILSLIDVNNIDIVLLDIDSPISKGLNIAREITKHYPNTKVIIMTAYFNDDELFETLKTGAVAYLDKRTNVDTLIETIKRARRGEYPINESVMSRSGIAERVLKQFQEISSTGFIIEKVTAPLTRREVEILSHIANGNSNKQIAHLLGISDQTIKNHVSAILRKLNANDRAHAVAMAIQNQWVTVDIK